MSDFLHRVLLESWFLLQRLLPQKKSHSKQMHGPRDLGEESWYIKYRKHNQFNQLVALQTSSLNTGATKFCPTSSSKVPVLPTTQCLSPSLSKIPAWCGKSLVRPTGSSSPLLPSKPLPVVEPLVPATLLPWAAGKKKEHRCHNWHHTAEMNLVTQSSPQGETSCQSLVLNFSQHQSSNSTSN